MTGSFYSYNVIGGGGGARAHLERLKPRVIFYMDAMGEAEWAINALPDTVVIHRVYKQEEDGMHRTPGRTLQHLKERASEIRDKRIFINLSCEPQVGGKDDLQKLVTEQLAAMQWAVANGYRVAGPHGAFYGLETEAHWRTLEPLTTFIAAHPDSLLFTVDEYFAGHAFSGVVDPSLPGGNENGHIQPETWKASPVPHYYHKGRITNYFRWLKSNGKLLPPTVITEDGADALSDVETWRNALIKSPGYSSIRGWLSLTSQWQAWYGNRGWSPQRAYIEMLTAFWREVYRAWPNIIGSCLYCWGSNNDRQWDQFRLDGATEFQSRLEATAFETGVPPVTQPTAPPEPTPAITPSDKGAGIAGTLYTGDYVNLRPAPATNAEPRIEIPNGAGVVWYPATERTNSGWTWVYVETGNRAGWMARVWPSWSTQFAPITPDVPLKPAVSLDIPWVSQLGSDAPDANDCGPAAATSAIRAAGLRLDRADLKAVTPNAFNDHLGNKQTGADVNDMVTALGRYGVTARALRATTANIKRQLSVGNYPIVVIERGAIPSLLEYNEFAQAHWLGVRAYDADGFTLVDPLVTNGRDLRVTEAELATALSGSTWNGVRQSGYIGIAVELPPLPVVVVPTPVDPPPPVETIDTALMALNAAMLEWGRRDKVARAAFEDSTAARQRFEQLLNDYLTLNSMENAA